MRYWLLVLFAFGVYMALMLDPLTWDSVVAVVLFIVAALPVGWRYWRQRHPVKIRYSLDSYGWQGQAERTRRFAAQWEVGVGCPQLLLCITPHVGFHWKRVKITFVERKWFTHRSLWKWVVAMPTQICPEDMRDMFETTSSSPLYYFDAMPESASSAVFVGELFDDHDSSKGRDIAQGELLWIGVDVKTSGLWNGRLEIEMPINRKRILVRKRFRVVTAPRSDMANFRI